MAFDGWVIREENSCLFKDCNFYQLEKICWEPGIFPCSRLLSTCLFLLVKTGPFSSFFWLPGLLDTTLWYYSKQPHLTHNHFIDTWKLINPLMYSCYNNIQIKIVPLKTRVFSNNTFNIIYYYNKAQSCIVP